MQTPVQPRLTKCVEVDSRDHTYLCGKQMVPTHNSMKDQRLQKIKTVQDYIDANPTYHLQANEYMRMSGIPAERVLLMSLTFPFEMREFVIEYDPVLGQKIADKYERVLQAVADARMPMCCGENQGQVCPARSVCNWEMSQR